MKALVILGMLVGSYVGSLMPLLWGEGVFSMSSLFFSGLGGILGIWASYKIAVKYL